MSILTHHHPCARCGAKTPCAGRIEENYDGCPDYICVVFNLPNGETNADFVCEGCSCVECGERGVRTTNYYTGPDTYEPQLMCEPCANRYENREPEDPDGEAFRGGEAAAYQADQQAAARRLK